MRLLADQLAPALEVDTPGRDQRIIGPQPRFLVADVAGEAERRVEKAAAESTAPSVGMHEQDAQLRCRL